MKIQSKIFLYSKSWSHFSHNSQFYASCVKPTFYGRASTRNKRRILLYTLLALTFLIAYLHLFLGIFYRLFEKDFLTTFDYPENIEDFPQFIQNYKFLERTFNTTNSHNMLRSPTNQYYSSVEFLKRADSGCSSPIGLLIIVKSATTNFEKRKAVRSTWGHPSYLKNNSISENLPTKLVFITGQPENESDDSDWLKINEKMDLESEMHHDIISATFTDTYNNNTYKSMSALRWAKEICGDFRYLFLVDDDIFISLKNLRLYLKNPMTYEHNFPDLKKKQSEMDDVLILDNESVGDFKETNTSGAELREDHLFLGKLLSEAKPIRNQYGWNCKWFMPLEMYPYNYFPTYIPGMAILLSKSTVIDFVYASLFTRHLHIDDVYLGILAHKLKINATHSDYFIMLNKWKKHIKWTDYMIVVHNYTPQDLIRLWTDNNLGI